MSIAQGVLCMCSEGFIVHIMHARKMRLRWGATAQRPQKILFYAQTGKTRGVDRDSGSEAGMWRSQLESISKRPISTAAKSAQITFHLSLQPPFTSFLSPEGRNEE